MKLDGSAFRRSADYITNWSKDNGLTRRVGFSFGPLELMLRGQESVSERRKAGSSIIIDSSSRVLKLCPERKLAHFVNPGNNEVDINGGLDPFSG